MAAALAGIALMLVAGLLMTPPAPRPQDDGVHASPSGLVTPMVRPAPASRARSEAMPRATAVAAAAARNPEPSATGELSPVADDEPPTPTGLLLATSPSPASGTWWAACPNGPDRAPPTLRP
jgi:hypothetical protein